MTATVSLLVRGGHVVTMGPQRAVLRDGAVAVAGSVIAAVGPFTELRAAHPDAAVIGAADSLVTPGYVNGHQHLTGDRLIASCIPEDIDSQRAIFGWAIPVHAAHSRDDDELSATLAMVSAALAGVTCVVEAGTVAHPEAVAAAAGDVGMRLRLGTWGWDIEAAPFAAPAREVLARQEALLDRYPAGGLVEGGVALVGHDMMSDELATGAADLARRRGVGLTLHMSPHRGDAQRYLARTGRRPLAQLHELGVLGRHLLLAHGVHLDRQEVELVLATSTAVVSCPWAYLRLAQGFTAGCHRELYRRGARLALGCDAENAGDAVDVLRAATLFAGLVRDLTEDPLSMTAADALAMATIGGAEAIGKSTEIGSLDPGKQADVAVHSTRGLQFLPLSADPVRQLVWAGDGRSVSDVLIAGRVVVRDGRCVTIDVDALRDEAAARRDTLLAGVDRSLT